MCRQSSWLLLLVFLSSGATAASTLSQTPAPAPVPEVTDLTHASPDALLKVYAQLRSLQGSDQTAITENVVFKRDAATFTFKNGHITFAAPVAGRIVAAVFTGEGAIEIDPPSDIDRHQIERFTKEPKLADTFKQAVLFFTDGSYGTLLNDLRTQGGGDAAAATKALSATQSKFQENFNEWYDNQMRDNPPMRNLAARMLADLADPTSRGLFLADFKADRAGDLLLEVSWNRETTLLPGLANGAEVMLIRYRRNESSEWWSGFHLKSEYASNPHPAHYEAIAHASDETIDAEVAKDNRVSATADLKFVVPVAAARVLPFNLSGVLRISSITDGSGQKLSFIQEDRKLDSDPWVILPAPATDDQAYEMKVSYDEDSTHDTRIVHQQGSGLYYVTARTSWYPSFGAFNDRTNFTLHFRSPKKFKFVATGALVNSQKDGNDLVTTWKSQFPFSVVGFNYGDFVNKTQSDDKLAVTAYSGKEPPDELKALSSAIDMADFAGGPGGSHNTAGQLGIMPGGFNTASMAGTAAAESFQAFKLFEFYFGQLPFKDVSVTEQPIRGYAQSWPTLIFLPYDSFLDSTTRQSLRMQDSPEAREFYKTVAVHEMSHQWWGHMVGWKTYHDQWLSEGFADFSAGLYLKQFEPKKFRSYWDLERKWLFAKNRAGHRPIDVGPIWLNYQTDGYLEDGNSQILIYRKGAYVLEMLRCLMEDPRSKQPDAAFIGMMRDFVSTYSGKDASTADFKKIVEKHFREPMDWFFNEWVYGTEVPRYDLSYELKDGPSGQVLHLTISQADVSDSFFMKVPLYAWVQGEPQRLGFISMKGPSTFTHDIPLPMRADKITIDEYHSLLAEEK